MTKRQVTLAGRRQRSANTHPNRRSAIEATVRSVKHPFRQGKLPVRGRIRVSMMLVASAAMTNVRRIWRYYFTKKATEMTQKAENTAQDSDLRRVFFARFVYWVSHLVSRLAFHFVPT